MTVEEKLKQELDAIEDKEKLKEIILGLSGALLNIKSFALHVTALRTRVESKTESKDDAAYVRFLSLLLSTVAYNMTKRKKKKVK